MEVVASLSQGRIAAAQCGFFTYKSVPVIFEPPCMCIAASSTQPKLGTSLLMFTVSRAQAARVFLGCIITLSILLSTDKLSRSVLCPARRNIRNF